MLFSEVVQYLPGQPLASFRDLEDDDPQVGLGRPFSDELFLQQTSRQAGRRAFFKVKVFSKLGDGHGAVLYEGLECMALADREIVAAGSISVSELEDSDQVAEGFLKASRVTKQARALCFVSCGDHGPTLSTRLDKIVVSNNCCKIQLTIPHQECQGRSPASYEASLAASHAKMAAFRSRPHLYWPKLPISRITRWQGMR